MTTITPNQVKIVQIARRQVERASGGHFDEAAYQTLLRNCGVRCDAQGRCSSKSLMQAGFEKLMAVMEGMGYRVAGQAADHWRARNARRTGFATSRQVYEIRRLAIEQPYPLSAICRRASNDQHSEPENLTTDQARKLIEALKAIGKRQADQASAEATHG